MKQIFKLISIAFFAISFTFANLNSTKAPPIRLVGRVEYDEETGSATHNGVTYARGEFFKDGNEYYAIPCDTTACIRQCFADLASKTNLTFLKDEMSINISHEGETHTVRVHDHFHILKEQDCQNAFQLTPEDYDEDKHIYLANGSLHLFQLGTIVDRHEYCVLVDENGSVQTLMCQSSVESDQVPEKEVQYYIYPVFMILSIICLLLTLLAFVVTPEMRTLHGKSIAGQSFTLMMAFIGFFITYITGVDSHLVVCKIFAYLAFGFLLSSFYWLNTMCFDIFWTFSDFKKMTGSLTQTSRKKFRIYAIYSTIIPLIISSVTIILDLVLDEKSDMWPGIGSNMCWFRNKTTEFMFSHVHLLITLLANTVFFILTLIKITSMKRETQVLKRGDSMTHGGRGSSTLKDRQRLILYVKLFILMGGTWVMELISWAVDNQPRWLWIPFDIINCSRGCIIFIFCVVTNQDVCNSLLRRYFPKFVRESKVEEQQSSQSKVTIFSD